MPEKDEFTFDDNDDFPETDLSDAFADAEQEASEPPPEPDESESAEMFEESEPAEFSESFDDVEEPFEEEEAFVPPPSEKPPGTSKSRTILLLLLLIVAIGAGAYYFMGLGELTSDEPAKKQTSAKVVAVPPPKPAASTVPVAPPKPAEQPAAEVASQEPTAKSEKAPVPAVDETGKVEQTQVEASVPAPAKPAATAASTTKTAAETVKSPAETATAKVTQPVAPPPAPVVSKSGYTLDAGAFLFAAQRDELKKKIRALGYEPEMSQVKASVRLIRLKVGSYTKAELPAALEKTRKITPEAFSMVRDGQHVIYAGSFADQNNVQKLNARFLEEGITLIEEPVKVEKTLSRIRFGRFADDASAAEAAAKAVNAGIPARVVAP